MDIGVIAKRYAKALLKFAQENQAEDQVYDEVLMFAHSWKHIHEVSDALGNPLLSSQDKIKVICQAASTAVSPVFQKFAELVVAHHRESLLIFITHSYVSFYRELKHISIGRLITAVPVDDKEADRLEQWMEEQTANSTDVILDKQVNPDILGGFIFEIDDLRLDASVATQFEQIKKQFIEKNKRIV